ncbi:hypothetical protein FQR65_LT06707 [Abscondita terminalis]|nr:hypothetical protein FQR65_LT06707 [Abscondita terminalis]
MNTKTVIITGGSKGLGKEAAKLIAAKDTKIILACRNIESGQEAYDEIVSTTNNTNIKLKMVDLSDFASVREFSDDILTSEYRLDVLIHCASTWLDKNAQTPDGFDLTMATNAMGPFLLTHLLIDLLKRSAPSRIVFVTSSVYIYGRLHFDRFNNYVPSKWPQYNYFNSKFAIMCIANEMARRLENTNVTVNTVHPGIVIPERFKSVPLPSFVRTKIFKSPEEGAIYVTHVSFNEEIEKLSGVYFLKYKQHEVSKRTQDEEQNEVSWEIFKLQTGVGSFDPKM